MFLLHLGKDQIYSQPRRTVGAWSYLAIVLSLDPSMPWFRGRTVRRGAPRHPRRGLEPHDTLSDTELSSTRELGGKAGQRNNFSMNSICFRKAFRVEKLLKQLPAIPQPAEKKYAMSCRNTTQWLNELTNSPQPSSASH